MLERRKLIWRDLGDEVVSKGQGLEPFISGKRLRFDLGDVVVGQVKLHHDLEVLERVGVNFLKGKNMILMMIQVKEWLWPV